MMDEDASAKNAKNSILMAAAKESVNIGDVFCISYSVLCIKKIASVNCVTEGGFGSFYSWNLGKIGANL